MLVDTNCLPDIDPHVLGWEDYFIEGGRNPYKIGSYHWRGYEAGYKCANNAFFGEE